MRLAVFSDIHGNLDAFKRVLDDIDAAGPDSLVCLGDNVGYGPEPEGVVALLKQANIPSVMGNHDQAVAMPENLSWFNLQARQSLEKTILMMSDSSRSYLGGLKPAMVIEKCRFVHGFPPEDISTYLFEIYGKALQKAMAAMNEWVCFVGHTHDLEKIVFDGDTAERLPLCEGRTVLQKEKKYIINIGSVGQPRDGDNRAKYVLFDTKTGDLELRCVGYDIETVVNKIMAAGLPEIHARRLW